MNRLERLEKILNKTSGNPYHDEKGRFTFNPGQGRGVGKPARGFSSPTVIYTGDDIKLEKDGVILEGTLQYKDGKFYLLTDKEKSNLIEISKDDIRKSIVSKSAKEKQKELLESQGIRHKTPKERRTPEQKRLISELDKMGLLKDKEFGSWCMKYADEETLADIYTTLREAESFGLDISSIQLGKIRSGQTWGRAYYRTDGNFKLALSGQIYDRNPIQEMKIKECREGFHTDNSIKAVVRHETGHIISYQNAQRSFNTKDKPKNIWQQEDKIDSYCGKVVSEAMGYSYFTYRETLKDLKNYSNSEISEYGRTNFKEAIAESWSNPNYSLFTKKVSDILKKDLEKPRENSIMNERTEEIPICSGYGPEFEDFEYETSTGKVKTNSRIMRLCSLEKVINSQKENLDYRYDVKAYKEYLKEWLKHKDEKEYLEGGVLSFAEFWEHDIDYEFEDYNKILKIIDEHNKKKELVTNGGPNSGNHNPGQGRGVGKPANSIDVSKYSTYEDFEQDMFRGENRKENIEKLKEQGINSKDKMYLYFVNEKFKKQKITQMSLDEAKDTILENIPKSVAEGWFIKADSNYKKKIVKLIVENDNLRSASLSLAYETYKELVNKNIGFNDFLNKELDLYRGDPEGKKFIESDSTSFISYTPFEDIAKKFGKVITKKTIKPKETLGVLRQVGEFEFLVPTFNQKKDVHKSKNSSVRMNDLLQKMDKILNGGPGSGNHNPGQGRGVGKPANGHSSKSVTKYSADKYLTKAEHEKIINHSSEDNFTDDELDAIAKYVASMRYGASSDLNQAIKANSDGEITETENILFPEDDSQIVTWKDNKEFIEQKIKDKKKYDSLNEEISLESSILRKGGLSDEKEIENLKAHISELVKERDDISKTLNYYDYENYIKNYEKGMYDSIKDDQKMWTINEDKLSKISVVKLREKQKSDSKRFDEVLKIPRLTWSMSPDDKPTTTDTLANVYQEDFKNLDKLDNIIKNKGFVLDKDITVTRRVANAKVIENQIKNKGEYTQNGITSVTAAKSIAKKMPSGVNMGDDLLRITIPAGTKVISTYNPFVRDVQKKADKYYGGNLTVDDKRNMRMIKGQNELILPSGSKFVSPKGNSISKNEDGSYQLILKVEKDKTSKNSLKTIDYLRNNISAKSYFRSQRLSAILNKVNRGNPYHDEKGRFSSKNGGYYKSPFVTKDGIEINESCPNFKELSKVLIKNKVKATEEKVLGKELLGRRIDILNSDSIIHTVDRDADDEKRVEEIKYQIETKKKSGIIPIIIKNDNSIDIVDGTHTFEAFMRLRDEGKKYYIPILITTPGLVEKWENKFKSIEDLHKSQKSLIKVREFEE